MQKFAIWPIGLGFYQGWLWGFFLNGPLLHTAAARWDNQQHEKIFLLFILCHSLSLLLIAVAANRLSPLRGKRFLLVTGTALMFAGTVAVALVSGEPTSMLHTVAVILATATAGFGAALLVAAWGELFSTLPVKQMGLSYARAVILGTALFFFTSRLEFGAGVIVTALYPFLSLIFLLVNPVTVSSAKTGSPVSHRDFCPLPPRLVLLVVLFYLVGGFMFKLIYLGSQFALQEMYWLTTIVYCTATLLAGMAIFSYPDLDLGFLYRPVLPLLGAGFLLFPLLHHVFAILPFALLQTGFGLFDTYTWLLFAYLAARYRFPVKIIGWGLFFITISIFIGEISFAGVFAAMPYITAQVDVIAVTAVMLMLLAIVIFRDNRETFAGWENSKPLAQAAEGIITPDIARFAPVSIGIHRNEESGRFSPDMPATEQSAVTAAYTEKPPRLSGSADIAERFLSAKGLTVREREVLPLLLCGRNNPYIREQLNISNNTLKTHLRNIYHKFGVENRQGLLSLFEQFQKNTIS